MRVASLLLLALAACKATPPETPSPAPPPEEGPGLEEARWRAEAEQVLFERHMRTAELYRDALDIDGALAQVERALLLKPTSEKALKLRHELQRMAGHRAGEVTTLIDDAWEAQMVREEQRQVEARRALAEAREAEASGDFDRAAAAYKRAIFLAREGGR